MATATVNGVRLRYQLSGAGEIPLVLVHGSWGSHHNWDSVVPILARTFRVVTYDRRGHSESERSPGQGSVRDDVADLAGLVEHLELGATWVSGNSFGATITLRLAVARADLLRGIMAHEPPVFALLRDDISVAGILEQTRTKVDSVVARIASGDHAGAAQQFVETVAFGPGAWARLPAALQETFIRNAPTYLDEARDPEQLELDLSSLRGFSRPVLLTLGDQSPPTFAPVVAKITRVLSGATVTTFAGAGHIPHVTHPQEYAEALTSFMLRNSK